MDPITFLAILLIVIAIAHFLGIIRIVGGAARASIRIGRILAVSGPVTLILLIIAILLLLLTYGYI